MNVEALIREIRDFPKPGIGYKDITPLLADGEALRWIVDRFAERYRGNVDAVIGVESRGFLIGAPVAVALGVGLGVVRKPGKLPHDTHAVRYDLEYGSDELEIHVDALAPGARVVVMDDLLATGGTAAAALELVGKLDAVVVEAAFLIELAFLGGAEKLRPSQTYSLIRSDP